MYSEIGFKKFQLNISKEDSLINAVGNSIINFKTSKP